MTSCAWRSDSTHCLTITFQSFGSRVYVSKINAAFEIYSEFILLMLKAMKAKLIEIKFIYRAMHTCIEFELKISDRKKSFSCLFDNLN